VITKKVDEVCWLRGSEVKASLRFWWRALYGHAYSTSEDLHKAESRLFGSAKGNEGETSPVAVVVTEKRRTRTVCADNVQDARKVVYFAGQKMKRNDPPGADLMDAGATASISLVFRKGFEGSLRKEVEGALVAWLVFGGVGSRTRRGAGAMAPVDVGQAGLIEYPTSQEKMDAYLKCISEPTPSFHGSFFSLKNKARLLRSQAGQTAQAAHAGMADHWRSFRQNRRHHAKWRGNVEDYGQNRWPEADMVRDATNTAMGNNHQCHSQHRGLRLVPRALLGLPIIIHFPDQPPNSQYQVINRYSDRYGSPVWMGVARVWNGSAPVHFGIVAVTPFLLKDSDIKVDLKHLNRSIEVGPVRAAYPSPRDPRTNLEPNAWALTTPEDMLLHIVEAFRQPGSGHESVATPHFQIIR
jgi:CRISPR-associated protein Cmr1